MHPTVSASTCSPGLYLSWCCADVRQAKKILEWSATPEEAIEVGQLALLLAFLRHHPLPSIAFLSWLFLGFSQVCHKLARSL